MFSRDTIVRTAQSARAHTPAFRRQEGKPVTEGKRSAGIVSTFLSAIGIGLAFSWYLFPVAKSNAHIFHTGPLAGTLPVSVGIVIPLVLLGLLGNRLDEKKARRIVLAAGLALCLVSLVLAECIRAGLLLQDAGSAALSLCSASMYGLAICLWAQNLRDRTVRGAMVSVSLGLLVAGASYLALTSAESIPSALHLTVPTISFALLASAQVPRQDAVPTRACEPARESSRRASTITLYALPIGFFTTQFYTFNVPATPDIVNMGPLFAAGATLLFVSIFMAHLLDANWFLLLSGLLFCVLVLFWCVLPNFDEMILITTGTLHWASMLLLLAAPFQSRGRSSKESASMACLAIALFYLGTGLGSLIVTLGAFTRVGIGASAAIFLLITLAFAFICNKSPKRSKPSSEEEGKRARLEGYAALNGLTPRETEVFLLLAEGNQLKRIAEDLFLSENTVKRHRTNVYQKLGVSSRQELIDLAKSEAPLD
ncbi:hypothetical protein C1875_04695 [Eggerthella lenta]|jgi:DNA-binding CsgD family transcriptional regulator|uniref:HTH luxR-type domain-containing protein n=1 Tax=Eggerthella lenta TaxID=84112 RepID=A0A369MIW7_EGGLN|nr:hypothetical protein C1875_04695 [Eggerthella lenta]